MSQVRHRATRKPHTISTANNAAVFRAEVLDGLQRPRKCLPCKYFYDERGSQLFDQICELDEYYPTRTEAAIMRDFGPEMAEQIGGQCLFVEYGSGSCTKTRILLDLLISPAAYVPVDISGEHLLRSAADLRIAYPTLDIIPLCADYTAPFSLPAIQKSASRTVVYFPGSTIGNFDPEPAIQFLANIAAVCGEGGGLLIGVDLKKERQILEPAYNDRKGITAEFNFNLLIRINRELDANFSIDGFSHWAYYNDQRGCIEMHLLSERQQRVTIGDTEIEFEADETILTERSYKYSLEEFAYMACAAGFAVRKVWTDSLRHFSVQYLTLD